MMPQLIEKDDSYLRDTRIGILSTKSSGNWPISIPIWYEWDGNVIQMFSFRDTAKVRRIQRDPHASLIVSNTVDEAEYWVAVDGTLAVYENDAFELVERLAEKYWDLSDPERASIFEQWRNDASSFVRLVLSPSRIRHY